MTIGLVGQKCGMTRLYTEEGSIPVTVLQVKPNRVVQVKTLEKDGYRAIQVTTGTRKKQKVSKAAQGHYAKAGVEPGTGLWEFRIDDKDPADLALGSEIKLDIFSVGQIVDVIGTSKGKGFAGTIKRHHFAGGDATHGNSLSHRTPGSIGQRQSPGKVFKGKKMSGQLGNVRRAALSLQVAYVDIEKNIIMIKGAIPGAPGGVVIIRPGVKAKRGNH